MLRALPNPYCTEAWVGSELIATLFGHLDGDCMLNRAVSHINHDPVNLKTFALQLCIIGKKSV